MNHITLAKNFDREDRPFEAIREYEIAFKQDLGTKDDYINAAFILFLSLDYGYSQTYKLSKEFAELSWEKILYLLKEVERKWGKDLEIDFLKDFFKFISFGGSEIETKCLSYIKRGATLPYLYLILIGKVKASSEGYQKLYGLVKLNKTIKDRYIQSILDQAKKTLHK